MQQPGNQMKGSRAQSKGANSLGGEGEGEDTLLLGSMYKNTSEKLLSTDLHISFLFQRSDLGNT